MSNHHNLPTNRRITRGSTKQQTQQLQQQSILLGSGKKSLVNQLGRFASNSDAIMLDHHSSSQFNTMNPDHQLGGHASSVGHYNKSSASSVANQRGNKLKNELDLQLLNIMEQSAVSPQRSSEERADDENRSDQGSEGGQGQIPQLSTSTFGQANRGVLLASSTSKKQLHALQGGEVPEDPEHTSSEFNQLPLVTMSQLGGGASNPVAAQQNTMISVKNSSGGTRHNNAHQQQSQQLSPEKMESSTARQNEKRHKSNSKSTTVILPFASPAKTVQGSAGEGAGASATAGELHNAVVLPGGVSHSSSRVVLSDDKQRNSGGQIKHLNSANVRLMAGFGTMQQTIKAVNGQTTINAQGNEPRLTRSASRQTQPMQHQDSGLSGASAGRRQVPRLTVTLNGAGGPDSARIQNGVEASSMGVEAEEALSSFLRGISQIRLSQMRENVLPRLKTAEEKRRALRSTMALDYLHSKNVRRKILIATDAGALATNAEVAATSQANAAMRNCDAQIQQVSIGAGPMASTGIAEFNQNVTGALGGGEQHGQHGLYPQAYQANLLAQHQAQNQQLQQQQAAALLQHQQAQFVPLQPLVQPTDGQMTAEEQLQQAQQLQQLMALQQQQQQAAPQNALEELIMIYKAKMQQYEDAIRVIEEINRLVGEAPQTLLPVLQQAGISIEELEQVKTQLFQMYQEQKEQLYQLIASCTTNPQSIPADLDARREEAFQDHTAIQQMTTQFNDLRTRLKDELQQNGVLDPQQQQELAQEQLPTTAEEKQIRDLLAQAVSVAQSQQQMNALSQANGGGSIDPSNNQQSCQEQQALAMQAHQELQYQIHLEQQLHELMTNPHAFSIRGDIKDQETLLKIQDLRGVLQQLIQQQSGADGELIPREGSADRPGNAAGNDANTLDGAAAAAEALQAALLGSQGAGRQDHQTPQLQQQNSVQAQDSNGNAAGGLNKPGKPQQQQTSQGQPDGADDDLAHTQSNLTKAANLLQQKDEIEAILQLQRQLNQCLTNSEVDGSRPQALDPTQQSLEAQAATAQQLAAMLQQQLESEAQVAGQCNNAVSEAAANEAASQQQFGMAQQLTSILLQMQVGQDQNQQLANSEKPQTEDAAQAAEQDQNMQQSTNSAQEMMQQIQGLLQATMQAQQQETQQERQQQILQENLEDYKTVAAGANTLAEQLQQTTSQGSMLMKLPAGSGGLKDQNQIASGHQQEINNSSAPAADPTNNLHSQQQQTQQQQTSQQTAANANKSDQQDPAANEAQPQAQEDTAPQQQPEQQLDEEEQDRKLQVILQMLQPYAHDPTIQERLMQIQSLQEILRRGTPEQKKVAQERIIEYVESLQSLDLSSFQLQQVEQQTNSILQQQQQKDPATSQTQQQAQATQGLPGAGSEQHSVPPAVLQSQASELSMLLMKLQQDQAANNGRQDGGGAAGGGDAEMQATSSEQQQVSAADLQYLQLHEQQLMQQLANAAASQGTAADQMQIDQAQNDYLFQLQLQQNIQLLLQQQLQGQDPQALANLTLTTESQQKQLDDAVAAVQQLQQQQQQQQEQQVVPNATTNGPNTRNGANAKVSEAAGLAGAGSEYQQQQQQQPGTTGNEHHHQQPSTPSQQLQSAQQQPQQSEPAGAAGGSNVNAPASNSNVNPLVLARQTTSTDQPDQQQQQQLYDAMQQQLQRQQSHQSMTSQCANELPPGGQQQQQQNAAQSPDKAAGLTHPIDSNSAEQQKNNPETQQQPNAGVAANQNNNNSGNNGEPQPQSMQSNPAAEAAGPAAATTTISEQEHQILLQQLQLNLQEQNQMKLGLQNQEGLQVLYEQNPQQLMEMLEHLQKLELMAEQMQNLILTHQQQQQQQQTAMEQNANACIQQQQTAAALQLTSQVSQQTAPQQPQQQNNNSSGGNGAAPPASVSGLFNSGQAAANEDGPVAANNNVSSSAGGLHQSQQQQQQQQKENHPASGQQAIPGSQGVAVAAADHQLQQDQLSLLQLQSELNKQLEQHHHQQQHPPTSTSQQQYGHHQQQLGHQPQPSHQLQQFNNGGNPGGTSTGAECYPGAKATAMEQAPQAPAAQIQHVNTRRCANHLFIAAMIQSEKQGHGGLGASATGQDQQPGNSGVNGTSHPTHQHHQLAHYQQLNQSQSTNGPGGGHAGHQQEQQQQQTDAGAGMVGAADQAAQYGAGHQQSYAAAAAQQFHMFETQHQQEQEMLQQLAAAQQAMVDAANQHHQTSPEMQNQAPITQSAAQGTSSANNAVVPPSPQAPAQQVVPASPKRISNAPNHLKDRF